MKASQTDTGSLLTRKPHNYPVSVSLVKLPFHEDSSDRTLINAGPAFPLSQADLCRGQEDQPGQLSILLLPQALKHSKNLC